MGAQLNLPEDVRRMRLTHGYFEDFQELVTGDRFTTLVVDGGTIAVADAANGVLVITTDATDNDENAIKGTKETFLMADGKPILFEVRAKVTEGNTDDSNIFLGMCDAAGANLMVDDGAGPKTTMSGFGFFKADGDTNWHVISSKSTTQTITELTAANSLDKLAKAVDGSFHVFRIEFLPTSSTAGRVSFWIDDVLVAQHDITHTSATEMQEVAYVKAGGANAEALSLDWLSPWQTR